MNAKKSILVDLDMTIQRKDGRSLFKEGNLKILKGGWIWVSSWLYRTDETGYPEDNRFAFNWVRIPRQFNVPHVLVYMGLTPQMASEVFKGWLLYCNTAPDPDSMMNLLGWGILVIRSKVVAEGPGKDNEAEMKDVDEEGFENEELENTDKDTASIVQVKRKRRVVRFERVNRKDSEQEENQYKRTKTKERIEEEETVRQEWRRVMTHLGMDEITIEWALGEEYNEIREIQSPQEWIIDVFKTRWTELIVFQEGSWKREMGWLEDLRLKKEKLEEQRVEKLEYEHLKKGWKQMSPEGAKELEEMMRDVPPWTHRGLIGVESLCWKWVSGLICN